MNISVRLNKRGNDEGSGSNEHNSQWLNQECGLLICFVPIADPCTVCFYFTS